MHAVAAVAATFAAIFEPELVQFYEPPTPSVTARTGCPHTTGTLLDWHDTASWNGAGVPSTAGADVTLPSSSRVLLSRSAAVHSTSSRPLIARRARYKLSAAAYTTSLPRWALYSP